MRNSDVCCPLQLLFVINDPGLMKERMSPGENSTADVVILGFLPRMLIEETTLRRELTGYEEYMTRIRWRLLPGVV